jgi:hypothetical protein
MVSVEEGGTRRDADGRQRRRRLVGHIGGLRELKRRRRQGFRLLDSQLLRFLGQPRWTARKK